MFKERRIDLKVFPTPLHLLEKYSGDLRRQIYIKRDDISTLGGGGNKLRKLEYLAFDAIEKGCDTLLTVGGVQTNHGRLTAAVAAKLGLKCILVLNGDEPSSASGNLILDKLFGADLYYSRHEAYTITQVTQQYHAMGHKVYPIGLGGSDPIGTMGYFTMMEELHEQLHEQNLSIKHLFVTAGSLGTLAGIILGNMYFNMGLHIHGVKIFPAEVEQDIEAVILLCNQASTLFGLGVVVTAQDVHLMTETEQYKYYQNGYNIPDERSYAMIKDMARKEGLLLDPCYTAKGFIGMLDFIDDHPREDGFLFIHTGGIPAIWTKEHLEYMQKV